MIINFFIFLVLGSIIYVNFVLSVWLRAFNIFPFNEESKERQVSFIITEYFIDPDKYFYIKLLHMDAAVIVALIVTIGTGTMLLAFFKYVCGMFKIAR